MAASTLLKKQSSSFSNGKNPLYICWLRSHLAENSGSKVQVISLDEETLSSNNLSLTGTMKKSI